MRSSLDLPEEGDTGGYGSAEGKGGLFNLDEKGGKGS